MASYTGTGLLQSCVISRIQFLSEIRMTVLLRVTLQRLLIYCTLLLGIAPIELLTLRLLIWVNFILVAPNSMAVQINLLFGNSKFWLAFNKSQSKSQLGLNLSMRNTWWRIRLENCHDSNDAMRRSESEWCNREALAIQFECMASNTGTGLLQSCVISRIHFISGMRMTFY